MKKTSYHINPYRVRDGVMGSTDDYGLTGAFMIPMQSGKWATVVASDGLGWEHVSVSLPNRCPNWEEMCIIKSLFWDPEEAVMQIHPKDSEYVNNHPYCLHLWRPSWGVQTPPLELVGVK